ncbi:MAG: hypothetical protein AB7F50_01005 [Fimbriimonadaceae bacterium]
MGLFRERSHVCEFKVCPLCGALNRAACGECHVCSWAGEFEYNEFAIEYALQSGRALVPSGKPILTFRDSAIAWVRRVIARCLGRFDILA